ncbi:hypothetical protein Barb7_01442 [Bacteroidales bacterium Barb7]|nr:hypothetical protein Barb6XT_01379 [Bacteroidales bacterium Barb6XT]OAV74990.1 hypothetical protein Barb7_01442 [Bacteroidales bacterium Barb7]
MNAFDGLLITMTVATVIMTGLYVFTCTPAGKRWIRNL